MTLSAFTPVEFQKAKSLLAARVAYMMGRKLEEADWAHVYCKARGLDSLGWSNLNADVTVAGLSLEHKMMRCSESEAIKNHCGTRMMHPALTRRVSLPDTVDSEEAMRVVITSYQKVLDERHRKAAAISGGKSDEMLTATEECEEILELVIGQNAYAALKEKFLGVSDEHCFQLLCKRLAEEKAAGS